MTYFNQLAKADSKLRKQHRKLQRRWHGETDVLALMADLGWRDDRQEDCKSAVKGWRADKGWHVWDEDRGDYAEGSGYQTFDTFKDAAEFALEAEKEIGGMTKQQMTFQEAAYEIGFDGVLNDPTDDDIIMATAEMVLGRWPKEGVDRYLGELIVKSWQRGLNDRHEENPN